MIAQGMMPGNEFNTAVHRETTGILVLVDGVLLVQ
jgi:hypothetical protein